MPDDLPPARKPPAAGFSPQKPAAGGLREEAAGSEADGLVAVRECLAAYEQGRRPERPSERAAVKWLLARLVEVAPGNSVEVRIPPYAAVQAVAGSRHRRGNPPATVECDARTLIEVATGGLGWHEAVQNGQLSASGQRSDLSRLMPLVTRDN